MNQRVCLLLLLWAMWLLISPTVAADSLHEAAAKGDVSALKNAISAGDDINAYDKSGKTALYIAAEMDHGAVITLLAKSGANLNAYKKSAYANSAAAIHTAAKKGNLNAIRALAEAGADLTLFSYQHGAPLHTATLAGRKDAIDLLVSLGADKFVAPKINHLLKTADIGLGQRIARGCSKCHALKMGDKPEGAGFGRVGPPLIDIVGRKIATVPDFDYSAALRSKAGSWTYDALNNFITDPTAFVPGTSMWTAGLARPDARAALIAYLRSESAKPTPLP